MRLFRQGPTWAETANEPAPTACRNCYRFQANDIIPAYFEIACPGIRFAIEGGMAGDKRFVYVLRNADQDPHFYVGLTSEVNARLADHNTGRCPHTVSRRPWQRHVVIEFSDENRAIRFERYLKSGSGRAFAKRHFEQ